MFILHSSGGRCFDLRLGKYQGTKCRNLIQGPTVIVVIVPKYNFGLPNYKNSPPLPLSITSKPLITFPQPPQKCQSVYHDFHPMYTIISIHCDILLCPRAVNRTMRPWPMTRHLKSLTCCLDWSSSVESWLRPPKRAPLSPSETLPGRALTSSCVSGSLGRMPCVCK